MLFRYIRFIYNRVILENAAVRAAAVAALAKFGASSAEILPSILVLLRRCTLDTDDEVRDRATFYYQVDGSGSFSCGKRETVELIFFCMDASYMRL